MDSRLTAAVAVVVGVAVAALGAIRYLSAGAPPPFDPFATGIFVVGTGVLLVVAGGLAFANALDHLALRAATGVGAVTLLLAAFSPGSLRFGGVFWLALVAFALVGAGAYRTVDASRAA
ncbi:hypothetical protein [Natronomonas gomsonensis]|uniref:hypothetical protein n=1 Tax=Natronomonas gomsonensis TaxID=1046043 RepID=UPI0015B89CD1|nr:hypothetical protein [Natronomonas gomsonensis]